MPKSGDKPGLGKYECKICGRIVYVEDSENDLPPCPQCYAEEYKKLI